MDNNLINLLEQTGFTGKEARVYLALLELGQGNVTDIAKITELKRSIIYVILEGLIKRGYASELSNKKINAFQAVDPSIILGRLKITTKNFADMLPIFRTLGNKGGKRPKITYHETKEGIRNVYQEMNQAKEAFFISSYEKIEKYFPGAVNEWINLYKKGIIPLKARHLVANNPYDLEVMKKFSKVDQRARFLPEIKEFNIDFTIYKNKLAITSLEDEPFIVIIESEALVKSMQPIFEIAWERGMDLF